MSPERYKEWIAERALSENRTSNVLAMILCGMAAILFFAKALELWKKDRIDSLKCFGICALLIVGGVGLFLFYGYIWS